MKDHEMINCECCGFEITVFDQTTECHQCGRKRCKSCDMGTGTVCCACEEEGDND